MSPSRSRLPKHLLRYVVDQDYDRYTPEDQAVWRYIMRQLTAFLSKNAHPAYLEGLQKTGIPVERIPKIEEMDKKLMEFGWGAVPVSGFIPPAAFMEFQSLGILPIASDMRTIDHLLYTPAPDIVHEAAGHAPILIDPDFAEYLKRYAEVASKAIISKDDMAQYEAIRILSDVKEDPSSTPGDIREAEAKLEEVNNSLRFTSEAGLLSRMNWWTAEYGLIGDLNEPKIFGAGLLSSLGEARECLKPKVRKLKLDIDCVDYSYDITEPQPQLFVTPDFITLYDVLAQLAERMSFKLGGVTGLKRAHEAQTVNTAELDSGLQISGMLTEYIANKNNEVEFIKFSGPSQLSLKNRQLEGHGHEYHSQGYSTPVGNLKKINKPLSAANSSELEALGLIKGSRCLLEFTSGFEVDGVVKDFVFEGKTLLLVALKDCKVSRGADIYFQPEWGVFDLAAGSHVASVFGGPADRLHFHDTDDFVAQKVPKKVFSEEKLRLFDFYLSIRTLRDDKNKDPENALKALTETYLKDFATSWLPGLELIEQCIRYPSLQKTVQGLETHLSKLAGTTAQAECIADGLKLAYETVQVKK